MIATMPVQIEPKFAAVLRIEGRRAAIVQLGARDRIDAAAVLELRRQVFAEGVVGRDEAEALFALERKGLPACPEWREFFVEAIVDHLLFQTRPSAVLNEEKAGWVISQADQTRTFAAFAVLVTALNEAQRVPAWFSPTVRGRAQKGWPGLEQAMAA